MRLIDADALLTRKMKSKYYHLPNGDIAIPIIDIEYAPTVKPECRKGERTVKVKPRGSVDVWAACECGQAVHLGWTYCPFCGGRIERK